jgi:hypothetical protein
LPTIDGQAQRLGRDQIQRRPNMNKLITATARKTPARSFTAVLAVAAMTVLAGANTAKAWDQQATEAQMDNELNYRAAGGYAYAASSRHRSGAYASAHSPAHIRGFGVAAPQRDFQMGGRGLGGDF